MNIPTLSHAKFLEFQETFRKAAHKSPFIATLVVFNVSTVGSFTDFTGDSSRTSQSYNLKCLYRRDFSSYDRQKFGLNQDVTGVVYISPKELVPLFGTFKLDHRKLKVVMHGITYMVDKVVYKSPYYDSCFAVEIRLKDPDRGGN